MEKVNHDLAESVEKFNKAWDQISEAVIDISNRLYDVFMQLLKAYSQSEKKKSESQRSYERAVISQLCMNKSNKWRRATD